MTGNTRWGRWASVALGENRFLAAREGFRVYRRLARGLCSMSTDERELLTDDRWDESVRRVRQFRDKHAGQRCFIIGNGPSLGKMDLSPLRNEITFGMNRIFLMFDELGFQTTYYVTVNKLVVEQSAADIAALRMPMFVAWHNRDCLPFSDNLMYLNTIGGRPRFAYDISGQVWESGTVTYAALQVAYYLGFKQVILIGVDHNFNAKGPPNTTVTSAGPDADHFSPNYFGKGFRWQLPDLYHSELGYQLARSVYLGDEREILDATVDGKLTVFPRVEFRSLFAD